MPFDVTEKQIVSLIIAAVILISTWELLSDNLRLAVDGIPDGVDKKEIEQVEAIPLRFSPRESKCVPWMRHVVD